MGWFSIFQKKSLPKVQPIPVSSPPPLSLEKVAVERPSLDVSVIAPIENKYSIEVNSEFVHPQVELRANNVSSGNWSRWCWSTVQKSSSAIAQLMLAGIGGISAAGMVHYAKNDHELENAPYYVLCGLTLGVCIQTYLNRYASQKIKKFHETFEYFNPEEISIVSTAAYALKSREQTERLLLLWYSPRAGMFLTNSIARFIDLYQAHRKKRHIRSGSELITKQELENQDRISSYIIKILCSAGIASSLLLMGRFGFNIFKDMEMEPELSIIMNDIGFVIFGGIAGILSEKFMPNNLAINKFSRILFTTTVSPGGNWQNWFRMGILGMITGYNLAANKRQIEDRRIVSAKQSAIIKEVLDTHGYFLQKIRENLVKEDEKERNHWKFCYKRYSQVFSLVLPSVIYLTTRNIFMTLRFGIAGLSYVLSYHATRKMRLTPYQDYISKKDGGINNYFNRLSNYLLNENPLPIGIVYVYLQNFYYRTRSLYGYENINTKILAIMYYGLFGILAGMERMKEFQLPRLESSVLDSFKKSLASNDPEISLSFAEQKYIASILEESTSSTFIPASAPSQVGFFSSKLTTVIKDDQELMKNDSLIREVLRSTSSIQRTLSEIPIIEYRDYVVSLK